MSDILDVMGNLLGGIVDFIEFLGQGMSNFIDFVLNLPTLFYNLINIVPLPLQSVILAFIGIVLFIIVMKVVSHFV